MSKAAIWTAHFYRGILAAALLVLVALMVVETALRLDNIRDDGSTPVVQPAGDRTSSAEQALAQAQAALRDVERTRDNLDLLLSFLQGMTVIAGLALGAAAYFGFRRSNEAREEIVQLGKTVRDEVDKFRPFEPYLPYLKQLASYTADQERLQTGFLNLSLAMQEFNLRNYAEAYAALMAVLEQDSTNPFALYMAGWLEMQEIKGKLSDGIAHLEQVATVRPQWPTAQAALGVALRRRAAELIKTDEKEGQRLYRRALRHLETALDSSPNLLDPNQESYWGPVGGIRRELGDLRGAIEAYTQALDVTPRSSYPQGNIAALRLRLLPPQPTKAQLDEVLAEFQKTLDYAELESLIKKDYFHMMDIAMSAMILGQLHKAEEALERALAMGEATPEKLKRSLEAGWIPLAGYCPDDWAAIKTHLNAAIEKVKTRLETLSQGHDPV